MISENLVEEINFDNVPNIKYVDTKYMDASKEFDPENKYSVPYLWGTVGILYNKTMVKEPVDSWGILWDTKYKDNILMQKSVRDAFGITLKSVSYTHLDRKRAGDCRADSECSADCRSDKRNFRYSCKVGRRKEN